jgi:hypothetical protein
MGKLPKETFSRSWFHCSVHIEVLAPPTNDAVRFYPFEGNLPTCDRLESQTSLVLTPVTHWLSRSQIAHQHGYQVFEFFLKAACTSGKAFLLRGRGTFSLALSL